MSSPESNKKRSPEQTGGLIRATRELLTRHSALPPLSLPLPDFHSQVFKRYLEIAKEGGFEPGSLKSHYIPHALSHINKDRSASYPPFVQHPYHSRSPSPLPSQPSPPAPDLSPISELATSLSALKDAGPALLLLTETVSRLTTSVEALTKELARLTKANS